jgi:hypothetical protein
VTGNIDLSGRWIGIFNYPTGLPPGRFDAELRDGGGPITGITSEKSERTGGSLTAIIDGTRSRTAVVFTKRYDDFEEMPHVVHYSGTVDASGDEIDGQWKIPGSWSGTFLMVRESKTEAAEERTVDETVNAP